LVDDGGRVERRPLVFGVREVELECEFVDREWEEAVDLEVDIVVNVCELYRLV